MVEAEKKSNGPVIVFGHRKRRKVKILKNVILIGFIDTLEC
jgi:hypothetical protein